MGLLDYGFSNVKVKELKKKGEFIKKMYFEKADKKEVDVILKDSLTVIEEAGDKGNYQYKVKLNDINLPIGKNTLVGKILVFDHSTEVSSQDLVLSEDVSLLNLWDLYTKQMFNILYGFY